jgi:hypothetical protein
MEHLTPHNVNKGSTAGKGVFYAVLADNYVTQQEYVWAEGIIDLEVARLINALGESSADNSFDSSDTDCEGDLEELKIWREIKLGSKLSILILLHF